MNKEFNYSLIIPHKNCPDLLQRCVDSIPERDDVQVIVVDDNSDEGKKPALKERKNLLVILLNASQSKGAGRARNVGLEHAEGKWLLFADSDDFFSGDISGILDKCENSESDIVFFKVKGFDSDTLEPVDRGKIYNRRIDNFLFRKSIYSEEKLRYGHYVPWGKVIRKSLVDTNNIRFDEVRYSNDVMFATLIGHYAKQIEALNIFAYCITVRNGSLVTQVNIDSQKCRFMVEVRRLRFICDIHKWKVVKSLRPTLFLIWKEHGILGLKDFITIMRNNGIGWGRFVLCEIIYAYQVVLRGLPASVQSKIFGY